MTMADGAAAPPAEFEELVRDALAHLYDPAHLQTHGLVAAAGIQSAGGIASKILRQTLLDAIETLHPSPGSSTDSRAWRVYRILELRYVEGREVAEVIDEVALSKAQYHREHRRALLAVASHLWHHWRLGERPASTTGIPRGGAEEARQPSADSPSAGQGPGWIEPATVLGGVVEILRPLYESKGIAVAVSLPDRLPAVQGDRVALRQAVLVVLAHALRLPETSAVALLASSDGGRLRLEVQGTTSAEVEGPQLGLDESRRFVDALGGDLSFESPASMPSRWSVQLSFPAADRPALLVVDNEPDFVSLIERYLAGLGWEVVGVADVDHAYSVAQRRRPSAILLDVVIPGRDGWDLLLELKSTSATREIPVIVCSVLDEPEVATSLGAAGYIQKPVDQRTLLDALRALA